MHTVIANRNIVGELEHLTRLALRTSADKTHILIFALLLIAPGFLLTGLFVFSFFLYFFYLRIVFFLLQIFLFII